VNRWLQRPCAGLTVVALLAGCTVGPNYHRPRAPVSATFKEAKGWTPSHPTDTIDKGAWWSMFNDPVLDGLEKRIAISNQTVKQYEAAYRQAHEIVAEARASFFPTLGTTAGAERAKGGVGSSAVGGATTGATTAATTSTAATGSTSAYASYSAGLEASWAPDLWGKIRRTVESDKALAQAGAANVANAKLSAQASLAEDYFELRVLDEEARLYTDTVAAYQKFLTLTQAQFREGTQPKSAVLTAETQLYGAQSWSASRPPT
jgi:outer membrane protein TolC